MWDGEASSIRRKSLGFVIGLVGLTGSASAQTTVADVRITLDEAIKARAAAEDALVKANKALALAERKLEELSLTRPDVRDEHLVRNARQESRPLAITSKESPVELANNCDKAESLYGNLSTSDRMLQKHDGVDGLNWYASTCLGMNSASQYKDSADLNIQFGAAKGDGTLEAGPSFTRRWLNGPSKEGENGQFYNSSATVSVRAFGKTGLDGTAALYDFTEFNLASGAGFRVGFEYGRSASQSREELRNGIERQLAKARRDCIAAESIQDPMGVDNDKGSSVTSISFDPNRGISLCSGESLVRWMSDKSRQFDYWKAIVRPNWGYDAESAFFAGAVFSYAWSDFKYFPLLDPAFTGETLVTTLPAEATTRRYNPFSLKGYMGISGATQAVRGVLWSLTGSISYRREYAFPKETKDKQVCSTASPATGADYLRCQSANLGPAYRTEGAILGGSATAQLPQYSFFPAVAFSLKPSYAFDTHRWGLEVPVHLFTDSEGKLTSGIKFACLGKGRTDRGYEIEDECAAAFFLGTKFKLSGAP